MTATTLEGRPVRWHELPPDKQKIAMLKLGEAWREPGFLKALNAAACDIYDLFGVGFTPVSFSYGYPESGPDPTTFVLSKRSRMTARADILAMLESWGDLGTCDLDSRLPVSYRESLVWEACREARKKMDISGSLDLNMMLRAASGYLQSVWRSHTDHEAAKRLMQRYCTENEIWFDSKGSPTKPPVRLWITQWREFGDDEDSIDVRLSIGPPSETIAKEHGIEYCSGDFGYKETYAIEIEDGDVMDFGPRRFKIEINEVKDA